MSEVIHYSPFQPVFPRKPDEMFHWGRLHGCSKALAISNLVSRSGSLVVVITRDMLGAGRMLEELQFFNRNSPGTELLTFPDWETLPYDVFSPYQDIISERLATLSRLSSVQQGILVVPVTTIMHRLLPREYLVANSLAMGTGDNLEIESFRKTMLSAGYNITAVVMEHGDIAIRGSLVDIYPMGSRSPYRIDLYDDVIDSIRMFDPETQRSLDKVDSIRILPAREIALIDDGIARFRSGWRERFAGNPGQCPMYRDVSQGLAPAGIEYYLPLFYRDTSHLLDYVPDSTPVFLDEDIHDVAETFWQEIQKRYEQGRHDTERPLLPPGDMFYSPEDLSSRLKAMPGIQLSSMSLQDKPCSVNFATTVPVQIPVEARAPDPLAILKKFIADFPGRILVVAESTGRRETLLELFRQHGLDIAFFNDWMSFLDSDASFGLTVAPLETGVQIDDPAIAIICESQLFGERVQQRRMRKRRNQDPEAIIRNLTELRPGAPVVHEENGVGRYQGLVTLTIDDIPAEFICIDYAHNDKLYVPVASLDLISRYTGIDPEHAPLHRLGSGQWEKARKKAAGKVIDVAAELLELHARRAAKQGTSFVVDENEYYAFTQTFPFEETPGQVEAIDAVITDLGADRPMDRLICGDAGFGKTEVAMRAAFIAIQNGRQVAVLVPTTLLAQQHYQNFCDRFADWPVHIESLSRFRSSKEQQKVLQGLAEGTIDIVIGTHKLLQDNMEFERLGLLIIDEEHRFGVRQKEKFRALRTEIDVLTLTATPIPRTLNMALSDLRELSIITTPPSRRLSVKTFVQEWNDDLLREAMLREIKRGGQVYFLHNKVENIERITDELQKLIPEANVGIAHGQMPEKQLERVMLDFYHRRFNVLVCTTIIETGIDIPSANTIIINRADKFGLAQLYQLRGRVGRSHHRAYAYMVIPPRKSVTKDAMKRLEAIESLEDLGIGFTLATHDLEIRGAGEILGEEQSGHIHEIGFGMYMELLERAVQALKLGFQPVLDRPLDHGADINLHIPSLIPEDYLPDVHTRLLMYKRIASADNEEELTDLQVEIIDRFGLLPEYLKNLFRIAELKLKANRLGIKKVDLGPRGGRLHFHSQNNVDPVRIINLVQSKPESYKLDGNDKIRIMAELSDPSERFTILDNLMNEIECRNAA